MKIFEIEVAKLDANIAVSSGEQSWSTDKTVEIICTSFLNPSGKSGRIGLSTPDELEISELELTVAGTKSAINMVESSAKQVEEDIMLEALMYGHNPSYVHLHVIFL